MNQPSSNILQRSTKIVGMNHSQMGGFIIVVPTLDDLRLATGTLPDMLTRFAHFLSAQYSYAQT